MLLTFKVYNTPPKGDGLIPRECKVNCVKVFFPPVLPARGPGEQAGNFLKNPRYPPLKYNA